LLAAASLSWAWTETMELVWPSGMVQSKAPLPVALSKGVRP
jgi:hypothetical protein